MAMLMYGLEMESMHLFQAKVEQREADIQDIEANLICYAGKNPRNLTEKKRELRSVLQRKHRV